MNKFGIMKVACLVALQVSTQPGWAQNANETVSSPFFEESDEVTEQTLLDRIRIEDLLAGYYTDYRTMGERLATRYFTEDAVLDVNGRIIKGHQAIVNLYAAFAKRPPRRDGFFQMMMGQPLIRVDGKRATAVLVWTGTLSDTPTAPARLVEKGREYDILEKRDGRWKIAKRTLTTDSGLPVEMLDTLATRPRDFDPLKN